MVYIKIGLYTTPSDVEEFIKSKWTFIKIMREELKKERGLPTKGKRIRSRTKEKRDLWIWRFSLFSNEKLLEQFSELIGIPSNYKALNIAKIINRMGYKVSDDNVRKIISLQKKLRK